MKYYLGIGIASVSEIAYNGWDGKLRGPVPDVKLFEEQLANYGYKTKLLLTEQATIQNVKNELLNLASVAVSGDTIVIVYSGHGGQFWDASGDEVDQYDETWCLYDGQIIDDVIYEVLLKFKKGVRILMFSDSCHSGTVFKSAVPTIRTKAIPKPTAKLKCTLKHFGGCNDDQTSMDIGGHGLFTKTLFNVIWAANGKIIPKDVAKKLAEIMPPDQKPTYINSGPQQLEWDLTPIFQ